MTRQSNHSNMNYRLISSMCLILFTLLLLLSGCAQEANNAGSTSEKDTTVASIKINPGGLMFTHTGDTQTLSATAYNAAGDELDITDFTWETSKPDSVSVDASGTAAAQTPLGSGTITAHAAGVTSTPLLVTIAQPVPGAVLVNDAQVVGDIRPHDTSEPLSLGSLYDVTLTGISPPEVGEILISTGEATVGGRVVEVREENGQTMVTLEFIGLDELFTAFTINETLPMSAGDIDINPELETTYDITHNPDGSLTFTPRQEQALSVTGAVTGTSVRGIGPFECGTDLSVFPLGLTAAPSFTLTRVFDYTLIWEDSYKKVAVTGTLITERTDSWALTSSLTGKVTCEIEIASLPLPVAGWLSMFFGGWVPVGLGLEASGQISLTGLGFEMKAKTGGEVEAGFEVSDSGGWQILSSYTETDNSFETKWTPPTGGIASGLRLMPSLTGYAFANLDIGFRVPRTARWQVLGAKLGLNLSGNLALVDGQIEDTAYASDYKLSLDASIGPGSNITNFLSRLHMNLSGAGMTLSVPLFTSPKALSMTTDVESFVTNDFVNFTIELDPETIEDLFAYNVSRVQIYHREEDAAGNVTGRYIGETLASSGQTEFSINWLADYDGNINDEFYAYVVSKFLPFPYFESLELGVATPTADRKIAFVSTRDGNSEIYLMEQDGMNQVNLTNNPAEDISPLWSSDGTRLAFLSNRDGQYELYVMNEDGGNLKRLSNLPFRLGTLRYPSWSPDGTKISYFQYTFHPNKTSINIVNANGSDEIVLEFSCLSINGQSVPMWSPDGTILYIKSTALVTDGGGNSYCSGDSYQIFAIDTETYEITQVTTFNSDEIFSDMALVSLSPDGTRFAFRGYLRGTAEDFDEIFTFNADGSGLRQVSNIRSPDLNIQYIVWSPDSRSIIFGRSVHGSASDNIMKIDAGGGTPVAIHGMIDGEDVYFSGLNNGNIIDTMQFSDDGREIIFSGYAFLHPNNHEIFRMNMSNRKVTNITQNSSNDMSPSIQP